ncbi:uncharacterized protein LOC123514616 isoform X2 [Portunus trituberculatus]|uniref:uncharacterized protein LOC123514616 isoform X2 n=1 Tax=Portunus trituberculatus TaxID=210409 RepID=UPI001E1CD6D5|nr:uncharacterized protein LOC123514616 isoform X2 [Portunus trituberculatus]
MPNTLCYNSFVFSLFTWTSVSLHYQVKMQSAYIGAVLIFQCATGAARDLLRSVDVPHYSFAGGKATLSCSYDLSATRLYSLKWYHNGTEFYRYVPTEREQPINIQPSHKFTVNELFRNDQRVTLSLSQLTVSASGQYRCEVIAEHPSFRTEAAKATMVVLKERLAPPVLVGGREIYEPTERIKIGCQLRQPFSGEHKPSLQWFLESSKVGSEWVSPYGSSQEQGYYGLSLHVPGEQVAEAGGSLEAECRLTLGEHSLSAYKTLRVRVRMISYVDNYHSAGSKVTYSALLCYMVTTSLFLMMV